MGVNSEGKLVPISGLRDNALNEEGKSESENDREAEEEEKNWKKNSLHFCRYPISKVWLNICCMNIEATINKMM